MANIERLDRLQDLYTVLQKTGTAMQDLEQGELSDRQFEALIKIDSLLFDALMVLDSLDHTVRARALEGKIPDPDLKEGYLIVDWHIVGPQAGTLPTSPSCDLGEQVKEQIVDGLAHDCVAGELSASLGEDLYSGWWKILYESDLQ